MTAVLAAVLVLGQAAPARPPAAAPRPAQPARPAALAPLPKTWDDALRGLHVEARRIRTTAETWTMTTEMGGQRAVMTTQRWLNGPTARLRSSAQGKPFMEFGYDGQQSFFVVHADKVYATQRGPNTAFAAKYAPPPADAMEDGTFLFQFAGVYDLMIVAKPAIRLVTADRQPLAGRPARRIVGRATNPKSKGSIEITLWLAPDRDRLLRAEAKGRGGDGNSMSMTLVRTAFDPAAKFGPSTFRLEPAAVRGFTKIAWPGG